MKGRLQHALRQAGVPCRFSRQLGFRTLGENRRDQVEAYIAKQVDNACFLDERFRDVLKRFAMSNDAISLREPTVTGAGRYWFDLHVVLVTDERLRFTDVASLQRMAEVCDRVASKKGYRLSRRAIMPDHTHLSLRGNIMQSPEEIALCFMNNITYSFGQKWIFRPSYYVGSFGEYDMGAVRHKRTVDN
jgi:REP element-mobilizing transposase RayT